MSKATKIVKDQVDAAKDQAETLASSWGSTLSERLPDKDTVVESLSSLRDDVVEKLADVTPDADDLVALRDQVVEKLPIEKKKRPVAAARNIIFVAALTAVVGAVVAYLRASRADTTPTQPTPPR